MTCTALHDVSMSLLETHKFRFVLTSRFNQDVVENWFSCIHGKGRNNDSRTTLEYESASKNIAINWMSECLHKGANCEPYFDSFIELVKDTQQQHQRVAADVSVAQCRTSAKGDTPLAALSYPVFQMHQLTVIWTKLMSALTGANCLH